MSDLPSPLRSLEPVIQRASFCPRQIQRVEPEDAPHIERREQFYTLETGSFEGPHQHETSVHKEYKNTKLADVPKEIPLHPSASVDAVEVSKVNQQHRSRTKKVQVG